MNLKDQILGADDRLSEDVPVPEWENVKVRVRGLSGSERDAYEAKLVQVRSVGKDVELRLKDFRSRLLVRCLYDPETDERIFGDNEVASLGSKSGVVIDRLHDVAIRLSGMDSEAVGRAEGNSESDPSDSSTTD